MPGGKVKTEKYIRFLVYFVALVLVNLAGTTLFFRVDLTEDNIYSLSDASQKVVATLSEPLTINAFFTKNLPAPHNGTEQYLRDLLEEYAVYANRYFNYRFYDVSPDEGNIGSTANENQQLARNYGINPVQIQAIEQDEVKFKKAYMGLAIIHGDLIERIPTITSTDRLEYQLTTAIMKLNNKVSALVRLEDKIAVKLILSSSLNRVAPFIGLNQLPELRDRIEEAVRRLAPEHFGKLEFIHLDPSEDEAAAREVSEQNYNVLGLKWPEIEQHDIAAGSGNIGLVLEHGKRSAAVSLVNVLRLPLIGTRYELVDLNELETIIRENIETLIDINEDLGYLADRGTRPLRPQRRTNPAAPQNQEALNNFRTLISQNYSIKEVRLDDGAIPPGVQCLVMAGPSEPFSEYELFQIDQFLMRGNSLALFVDSFNEVFPQQQSPAMGMNQGPRYEPLNTGLEKLLEHYGVRIKRSFVMDENCFKQELPQRMGGGERPIYFAPLIQNRFINQDLDFMQNIKRLVAVTISPLELIEERIKDNGLTAHRLFASSERSWEMRDRINLNPNLIRPPQSAEDMQSYPLAYLIEGEFPSYFEGKAIPEKPHEETPEPKADEELDPSAPAPAEAAETAAAPPQVESEGIFLARGKAAKIFILASSEMLTDNVLDAQGRGVNTLFTLNVIDALNGRNEIAVMRTKQQQLNPLSPTSAATKAVVKAFDIAGLPVLVVLFGMGVWFRRARRKKRIQEMFQK
jgi:ABC-type uncharacterized transport system involved in gliding motility auxiliary subunit